MSGEKQNLSGELKRVLKSSELEGLISKFERPKWPEYFSFFLISIAVSSVIVALYWDVIQSEVSVHSKWQKRDMDDEMQELILAETALLRFQESHRNIAYQCTQGSFHMLKQQELRNNARGEIELVSAGPYLENGIKDSLASLLDLDESIPNLCTDGEGYNDRLNEAVASLEKRLIILKNEIKNTKAMLIY